MAYGYSKELFVSELTIGTKWAFYVADFLNAQGISCHATEMELAETEADIPEFSKNEKDIILHDIEGSIEVKSRRLVFNDWLSYAWDEMFVDTVSGWHKKAEKPLAIIVVSQITGKMLVIPSETEPNWFKFSGYDKIRGIHDTWYMAKKKDILDIDEYLEILKAQK
jgi:hypothetical protein